MNKDNKDSISCTSDALLPGSGHVPDYGISDSTEDELTRTGVTSSTRTTTSSFLAGNAKDSKEQVWVVARCALVACLSTLIGGMFGGFSSPALPELNSTNPIQALDEATVLPSLFGSLGTVGAMFGGLLAWPVSDFLGRQAALIIGGIPALIGWLFIANAVQIFNRAAFLFVLFSGRVLTGFAAGWSIFCVSVYIAEISSPKLKGFFGNCNQLFVTLGLLLTYLLGIRFEGYLFHYYNIALVAAGIVALFELLMLTTYETPRWLFSKNRDYHGIRVLKVLRGKNFQISREIDYIKAGLRRTYSVKEQLLEFKHHRVYHPFILVLMLMFFQQFSGINVAIFYASEVFKQAGYDNSRANLATFGAVGVVQVIATFVCVLLVDYCGRRVLLVASSTGMALSCFLLGLYFFIFEKFCSEGLSSKQCPDGIEYLAILGVVFYISSFALGWGPIPWSSMSELLPNQVRSLGGSLASFTNWGFAAIVTLTFKSYSDLVSPKFTWWSFGVIMVLSIVMVILFLPEVKGRALEEIQSYFESGKVLACSCPRYRVTVRATDGFTRSVGSRPPSSVN